MLADLQRATTSAVRVAQAELHQIDAELRRLGKRSSRRSRKAITPNSQSVVPPIYATVVHVDSLTDAGKPVFAVSRAVIREAPRAEAGSQIGHNLYSNYSAMTRLNGYPNPGSFEAAQSVRLSAMARHPVSTSRRQFGRSFQCMASGRGVEKSGTHWPT
jgi:CRISPR/Cas system-associated endonuclease Cas3-HD